MEIEETTDFNSIEPQQLIPLKQLKPKRLAKQKVLEWLKSPENQKKTSEFRLGRIFYKAAGIYPSGNEKEWLKSVLEERNLSYLTKGLSKDIQRKKLPENILKWTKENPDKVKETTVSGIFKTVVGRYPGGKEKKQTGEMLNEQGIDYKKRGHTRVGLIDKVLKWLENSENRKKAAEMSISGICQEVAERYPKTAEKVYLEKMFLEQGIDYKKRFSLEKALEEQRKKKEAIESPLEEDKDKLLQPAQPIEVESKVEPTEPVKQPAEKKDRISKHEKVIKTKRIKKRSERDITSSINEDRIKCSKTRETVNYWERCRACPSREYEEKDGQGKILSIICEIEVPVK